MENIKLPIVGEELYFIVNNIVEKVKVSEVDYKDTKTNRKVNIKTNKGHINLWDLFETEYEAEVRLKLKGSI